MKFKTINLTLFLANIILMFFQVIGIGANVPVRYIIIPLAIITVVITGYQIAKRERKDLIVMGNAIYSLLIIFYILFFLSTLTFLGAD